MSGVFRTTFLEPKFLYCYEDDFRKIFKDKEQSDAFFREKDITSKKIFLSFLLRLERIFSEAHERNILINTLEISGTHQSSEIVSTPQAMVKALPGVVSISCNTVGEERGANFVVLNIAREIDIASATWLLSEIQTCNYLRSLGNREAIAVEGDDTECAVFRNELTVNRYAHNFSLAVSLLHNVRINHEDEFEHMLTAVIDTIFPRLEEAFQDESTYGLFFEDGAHKRLVSFAERFGRAGEVGSHELFNVHGPLLDEFGMRASQNIGLITASILFTFEGEIAHPNYSFTQWFERICVGEEVWRNELSALMKQAEDFSDTKVQERAMDALVRIGKDAALRTVGGKEVIDFLLKHGRAQAHDPMRILAIRNLQWYKSPESKEFFLTLLKERNLADCMSIIAQALAEFTDMESADALIEVLQDVQVSEDDHRWARYGLKQMDAYLKDPSQEALRQRIAHFLHE